MEKTINISGSFVLPKKKVKLVPIERPNTLIKDSGIDNPKKHIGYFWWDGATRKYVLPIQSRTGTFLRVLTDEEEAFISKTLDRDLSIYGKKDDFWKTFKVLLKKEDLIDGGEIKGRVFDLSDAIDFLSWKVLLASGDVAPSWDKRYDRGTYIMAFIEEGYEDNTASELVKAETEAYEFLSSIKNSSDKMRNFLNVYWLTSEKANKPSDNASKDFLQTEIGKIIKENLKLALNIIRDPNLNFKYWIHEAILIGAIKRDFAAKLYLLPDNTPLGKTLDQVVQFFKDHKNNEEKLRIDAQLELSRKENKKAKTD